MNATEYLQSLTDYKEIEHVAEFAYQSNMIGGEEYSHWMNVAYEMSCNYTKKLLEKA